MRHRLCRFLIVAAAAAVLAGCDKCADNFLVDPFKSTPHSCHGAPPVH